jgi:predicted RNA-binding protein (virulence factor B family)
MMNHAIEIGEINSLIVTREKEQGLYLSDKDGNEILLPKSYVTPEMQIDRVVDVFVYTDSEDRLVATTLTPYCKKGEFAFLEVVDDCQFGAFVDIGLPKHILVPKRKQVVPFRVGDKRVVKLIEDENTNRLIAVERFINLLSKETHGLHKNQEVDIILYTKTDLGYKVIVNNMYEGLIFHNEIFQDVKRGMKTKAYIKNVREDGKLDIILQPMGKSAKEAGAKKVLEILSEKKSLPYNYKSDAKDIEKVFGLSKKAFKKSLTTLKESGDIEISDDGISLINK